MNDYINHDLELDAYLDLQDYDDSDFKCPRDNIILKVYYTQNGLDDYYTNLICPECFFEEQE